MAKSKRSGKGNEAQYNKYKNTGAYEKNRKRRLARHLKLHPTDMQAAEAKIVFRRSVPQVRGHIDRKTVAASINAQIAAMNEAYPATFLSPKECRQLNETVAQLQRMKNFKEQTLGIAYVPSEQFQNLQKKYAYEEEHKASLSKKEVDPKDLRERWKRGEKTGVSRKKTKAAA